MSLADYAIQFAGALIQSAPVALFLFLPFEKYELKISGRRLYIIVGVFLAAYALIFTMYIQILQPLPLSRNDIQEKANIMTTLGLGIWAVFGLWNIKLKGIKKLFILLVDIYYEAIVYTLSSLVIHQLLFPELLDRTPYTSYNLCTLLGATAVTFPLMWNIMSVKLRELIKLMDSRQLQRSCMFMGAELFLYCIFMFFMPSFDGIAALITILCYIIGNVLALCSFLGEIHTVKKQIQMEEKIRMFDLEYASIKMNIEEMARFRHDMRHHFGVIAALNTEGKSEELGRYLKRYVNAYEGFENDQICDYPLINTILKYYMERCKRENIKTETAVNLREDLGFDFMDMTVLLGNCFENAINACCRLPEQERFICIKMMKMKGSLLIYIENSCDRGTAALDEKRWGTLPPMRKRHGYGTGSICKIAEKYDGNAEFKREDSRFVTRIVLNICSSQEQRHLI
ncbi:MAG: sensor histidine kinase [Clostridiales bacterium]|nr:sensor histidine kinase [Clostridiales bacterium]